MYELLLPFQSIKLYLGEANVKKLVNFCLHYIADIDIPKKRCEQSETNCVTFFSSS